MPAQSTEHVSFGSPDEVREFPHGRAEIVKVGDAEIGRLILEPGMGDGSEFEAGPGDVTSLPQGHDAWVVGDEPVVVVDWYGASNYAR